MVKITALYPYQEDAFFDVEYYAVHHMQLLRDCFGDAVVKIKVDKGLPMGKRPAAFIACGHLWLESIEEWEKQFKANAEVLMADVPRFTNIKPTMLYSEAV